MPGWYGCRTLYLIVRCLAACLCFQGGVRYAAASSGRPGSVRGGDPMSPPSLSCWLALGWLPGLSPSRLRLLLGVFGSPTKIIAASDRQLQELGLTRELSARVRGCMDDAALRADIERALAWCDSERHIVTLESEDYPDLLRQIDDPPPFIFVHGSIAALRLPQVAMVGSRRSSVDGKEAAASLAAGLARAGLTICSGMAAGIDSVAHQAALKAGGSTVAVLGTGVDVIYPQGNGALARDIVGNGALVSELPLGASPLAGHFPRRNRIISGLSLGVVIVEAALRSGTLITARLAMEQNREVFAVPGSIRNPLVRGCHSLIRDGVTLVESAEQVIEQLGGLLAFQLQANRRAGDAESTGSIDDPCDPGQRAVLEALGFDPVPMDTIIQRTGLAVENLHSLLLMLELEGRVRYSAGYYQRV